MRSGRLSMSEPAAPPVTAAPGPGSTRTGPGRLLVAVYALFALSASARAGVQIATKFSHAPVAYVLSAIAAVIYVLATVTLANGSPQDRRPVLLSGIRRRPGSRHLEPRRPRHLPRCHGVVRVRQWLRLRSARPSRFRIAMAAPLARTGQDRAHDRVLSGRRWRSSR